MSGEEVGTSTNNDIDMVDIDLEKDKKNEKDVIDQQKKKEEKKTRQQQRSKAATPLPTRLLPAALYATAMGRHVIDWSTSDEESQILLEWPGVRFTFIVQGTRNIAVRLQTAGAVFGYHVLSVDSNNDTVAAVKTSFVVEEQILGGGLSFFGRGGVKDHVLTTDLNASLMYRVEIWKRNDPGSISRLHGLLIDAETGSKGVKPNKRGEFLLDVTNKTPAPPTTTSKLHLEFVGDADTVGFGNVSRKTSLWYYGLCQMTCLPFSSSLQRATDVQQSWPVFLCRALEQDKSTTTTTSSSIFANGVQYSIIAWSGIGAKYSSLSLDVKRNMINVYPLLLPSDEMSIMKSRQKDGNSHNHKADEKQKKKNNKKKTGDNNDDDDNDKYGDGDGMSLPQPPVHAVIVYLGRNDVESLKDSDTYSEAKLTSAYETLLKRIRHRRPWSSSSSGSGNGVRIPIIVVVPSLTAMVSCCKSKRQRQTACELAIRLWTTLVEEKLGGPAAGFFVVETEHEPNIALHSKADHGMCLHWNSESHRKWARGLERKIRHILVQHPPASSASVPAQEQPQQEQQQQQRGGIHVNNTNKGNSSSSSKHKVERSKSKRDCV
jgi:hypothetical protein